MYSSYWEVRPEVRWVEHSCGKGGVTSNLGVDRGVDVRAKGTEIRPSSLSERTRWRRTSRQIRRLLTWQRHTCLHLETSAEPNTSETPCSQAQSRCLPSRRR